MAGRIGGFLRLKDLNINFCYAGKNPKQIKPQVNTGARLLSSFLASVTDLLSADSLPLCLTYKILHLTEGL